ncbi:MAG: tRNA epoxyqueuosine(34) reductase QueG [Alphaproteobacteria bacterium]|nr:tRNA epoxyqueuosine(34) reductase QueG [Alphaproteobacteria bacterium]
MSAADAKAQIVAQAKALGFDAVGVAPVSLSDRDKQAFADFLDAGAHGDMGWMAETADRRVEPAALWPDAASVITVGVNYGPGEDPLALLDRPDRAGFSVYAGNADYHDLVKKRLKRLARWIVETFGGSDAVGVKVFVDTAPVLEKAVAARSSVGWQGKHTNLVSESFGSWLFLGEVFTTLTLEPDAPHADRCGSCAACHDICPTDAFPAPYRLDARRCISYLTIEHKGPIPHEFRAAIGNRVYGCDDCLAVCPWNKFAQRTKEHAFLPRPELNGRRLADYLDLDEAGFRELFRGSPIKRIGRARFLRNILIGVGNSGEASSVPRVANLLDDPAPIVRGAAVWALSRLLDPAAFKRLANDCARREIDPEVRAEWDAARAQ